MKSYGTLLFIATFLVASTLAHTWLDCVDWKNNKCEGYARNYPGRLPGVDVDTLMTYRMQPGLESNPLAIPICDPDRQASPQYSSRFYMGKANAGDTLTMTWTPNAHIRPEQDPKSWTLHWTGHPETELMTRGDLNDTNKLSGDLYDAECSSGSLCFGHFTIPSDVVSGRYSFVWYWIFNRDPNGSGEEYSTCFDIEVAGAEPTLPPAEPTLETTPTENPTGDSPSLATGMIPIADAYVRGGQFANNNYGNAANLYVKQQEDPDYFREVFLKFDLRVITHGEHVRVTSASLTLSPDAFDSGPLYLSVDTASNSWTEQEISWNNKPAARELVGVFDPEKNGNTVILKAEGINEAINYDGILTLRIYQTGTSTQQCNFFSKEATLEGSKPQLKVEIQNDVGSPIEDYENPGGENQKSDALTSMISYVVLVFACFVTFL